MSGFELYSEENVNYVMLEHYVRRITVDKL